jgi:hypothetical protein
MRMPWIWISASMEVADFTPSEEVFPFTADLPHFPANVATPPLPDASGQRRYPYGQGIEAARIALYRQKDLEQSLIVRLLKLRVSISAW